MGRFVNTTTGVTFSVDDSKDERYSGEGYEPAGDAPKAATKSSSSKSKK